MSFSEILKQGLIIAMNRLLLLSMPFVDLLILGNISAREVAKFSLSSQYVQIIVILIVTSAIGINILIKNDDQLELSSKSSIGYVLLVSVIFSFLLGILSIFIFSEEVNAINMIFIIGMPFCALYVAYSSILETIGYAKLILYLSIIAALVNISLDIVYVNYLDYLPSRSVALSTSTVRIVQCILAALLVARKIKIIGTPRFSLDLYKRLFSFAISENITALLFVGSISCLMLLVSEYFDVETLAYMGVTLNFMNTVSIIFVSYCISFTINYTKFNSRSFGEDIHNKYLFKTCSVFTLLTILGIVFCPQIAMLYMPELHKKLIMYLMLSMMVIFFDGLVMYSVAYMRVNHHQRVPPLFRLAFVFIGLPLGSVIATHNNNGLYLVVGMLIGNAIAFILVELYYYFIFRKNNIESLST